MNKIKQIRKSIPSATKPNEVEQDFGGNSDAHVFASAVAECDVHIEKYLSYLKVERRLAARTLILYTKDLQKLKSAARAEKLTVMQMQPVHIRHQVAVMHSAARSARGIALILSGWRGFFRWAVRQGLLTINPVQDARAPKAARPLPKALGADDAVQLAAYRNAATASSKHAIELEARDAAFTELLYSSGLRVGELVGLNVQASSVAEKQGWGWIDWQEAHVNVFGKGGKRRQVPIGAKAMQALRYWLQVRVTLLQDAGESALFLNRMGKRITAQSVWQRLRRRSAQAGLTSPVHPHVLRHSFASHLLQSSGDLRAVQDLLGHANIATTQVYTRLDFQHLAKIYDAAHPRANRKK